MIFLPPSLPPSLPSFLLLSYSFNTLFNLFLIRNMFFFDPDFFFLIQKKKKN